MCIVFAQYVYDFSCYMLTFFVCLDMFYLVILGLFFYINKLFCYKSTVSENLTAGTVLGELSKNKYC